MYNYACLTPGRTYKLNGDLPAYYLCLQSYNDGTAKLQRVSDGYIIDVWGTRINPDETIEWSGSSGGHWPEKQKDLEDLK